MKDKAQKLYNEAKHYCEGDQRGEELERQGEQLEEEADALYDQAEAIFKSIGYEYNDWKAKRQAITKFWVRSHRREITCKVQIHKRRFTCIVHQREMCKSISSYY